MEGKNTTRNRVSRIHFWFNISEGRENGRVCKNRKRVSWNEVDMPVWETTPVKSTNSTLTVQVYQQVCIVDVHSLKKIEEKFQCEGFQPINIVTGDFPTFFWVKSNPGITDKNINAPECWSVDENVKVLKRSSGMQMMNKRWLEELSKLPLQIQNDWFGCIKADALITVKFCGEIRYGREVGVAFSIDKENMT